MGKMSKENLQQLHELLDTYFWEETNAEDGAVVQSLMHEIEDKIEIR